ncbi:MAG: M23 family metallopeptidase [Candidatus Pacebacteria bacterium]|nr:M23 family metallopeptidase [Candidatus Paceibacterota bacterium]
MTTTPFMKAGTALGLSLALLAGFVPALPAAAAYDQPPVGYFSALNDDDEEDEDNDRYSRSSRRTGYSSSIQRKVNKLDDDEVEELPIPILIGVGLKNIWPNFGDPRDGGAREHEGEDIMAPRGAIVSSPTEAVVVRTGEGSSSGVYVTTANPGGETMNFYHLDSIADGIKAGTEVEAGDILGYVGNTGNASGGAPHLHFEIRKNRKALNPFPRLTKEFSNEVRIRVLTDLLKELQAELAKMKR